MQLQEHFEIQGHRGNRGYYPENTIPGFLSLCQMMHSGNKKFVNGAEMDIYLTKDEEIVVHHNFRLNPSVCLHVDGSELLQAASQTATVNDEDTSGLSSSSSSMGTTTERGAATGSSDVVSSADENLTDSSLPLMMDLTLAQLQSGYDIGTKRPLDRFPHQIRGYDFATPGPAPEFRIPSLQNVVDEVRRYEREVTSPGDSTNKNTLLFNLEIKREPKLPHEVHPIEQIVKKSVDFALRNGFGSSTASCAVATMQRIEFSSFDFEVLYALHGELQRRGQRIGGSAAGDVILGILQEEIVGETEEVMRMIAVGLKERGRNLIQEKESDSYGNARRDLQLMVWKADSIGAEVVSPDQAMLRCVEDVRYLQHFGLEDGTTRHRRVIPWTVNNPEDWRKLALEYGVDGLITDYPGDLSDFLVAAQGSTA